MILNRLKEQGKFSVEHLGMILNRLKEQGKFSVEHLGMILNRLKEQGKFSVEHLGMILNRLKEQAGNILRRSLFAHNRKVYCLVNADLLDYEVSDKERNLWKDMKQAERRRYRLVVICSSENEGRSRIVTALDKYHRPQLFTDVATIRKYLLTKLKVERSSTGITPASAVDFERHCGIRDPSWSELYHFVSFLNKQLQDFEVSDFCSLAAVWDLPGFAKFVLQLLIQMSRVHGGTKASDIIRKVGKAEEMARKNAADYPFMDTVLFFDEANTTEAIGHVPMRHLVYRVQSLPQSMLPLVWDFRQLNTTVEEMYIRQMVSPSKR
ncbi:RNF213 [Mytilus edulis]|uniref:RNF213 n=1 Tax=Mytilus edulis TaxID=6550 RepID=A0A8S3RTC8_MYTED|nr:RNF213 [Mytilus edulis]